MSNTTTEAQTKKDFAHFFDKITSNLLKVEVVVMAAVIITCGVKVVTTFVI